MHAKGRRVLPVATLQPQRATRCQALMTGKSSTKTLGLKSSIDRVKQDKLGTEEYRMLENEQGLVALNPRYSPKLIREVAMGTPSGAFETGARFLTVIFSLGKFFLEIKADGLRGFADDSVTTKRRSQQLRELLSDLGPSFIKAGQVLANRPDIVREDYMEELTILQDNVPQFDDKVAMQMINDSLGRPLEEVFSSISSKPVAAASLGQVYKAVLRETGEDVAIKVQRPNIEPVITRDLFIFRVLAQLINPIAEKRLGCTAPLILDEFGTKLLEELDYELEARNIQDFYNNFLDDPLVKIPWVRKDLSGKQVLVMEWINGVRCTDPAAIRRTVNVQEFIRVGVVSGMRQLLEFGLFHGDPHPGNVFAMPDGRIAYVDFGNVAQLSQYNKQVLIDAVVHAVNQNYFGMAEDFINLGFLAPGTVLDPIVPALEKIWGDSVGQSMTDFNFRIVTSKFNQLVYQYPIRVPERYALVIRSLLTQEGICMSLQPDFHFLEVAYPYVAKRLLTDPDPSLRERLIQVLFSDNKFQWDRLENLIALAKTGGGSSSSLDLSETAKDALKILLLDDSLRAKLLQALTEDNTLHVRELLHLANLVQDDIDVPTLSRSVLAELPTLTRKVALKWSDQVLT